MKKNYSLKEITGCDSGIVIYPNDDVFCCHWGNENGLPMVWPAGLSGGMPILKMDEFQLITSSEEEDNQPIGMGIMKPSRFQVISEKQVNDCQSELPAGKKYFWHNRYFRSIEGKPGRKFIVKAGRKMVTVLCPDDWRTKVRVVLVVNAPGDYVLGQDDKINLGDLEIAEIAQYDPDYQYRGEAAGIWLSQLDADCFLFTEAVA